MHFREEKSEDVNSLMYNYCIIRFVKLAWNRTWALLCLI